MQKFTVTLYNREGEKVTRTIEATSLYMAQRIAHRKWHKTCPTIQTRPAS